MTYCREYKLCKPPSMLNKKLNMTVNAFYVSRFSEQNDPCQTGRSLI